LGVTECFKDVTRKNLTLPCIEETLYFQLKRHFLATSWLAHHKKVSWSS